MSTGRRLEAFRSKTETLPLKIDNKQHEVYLLKLYLTIQVLWGWCAIGWADTVHIMGFYHSIENTSGENLTHFYYEMNLSTGGDLTPFDIPHSWKDNVERWQSITVLPRRAKICVRNSWKIRVSKEIIIVSLRG